MLLSILLSAILIGLDQWTKWLAVQYLKPVGMAKAIPGVIQFRYVENTGAAFSFFEGHRWFLIGLTSIALLVLAYIILFRTPKKKLEAISLVFIFSGGVGNLIDRIANGFVVDFFDFTFVRFAVFNVADIFICVGFAILFVSIIRDEVIAGKQEPVLDLEMPEPQETGKESCEESSHDGE